MALVVEQRLARAEELLRRVWGFESFRPLQREAVEAALLGRDSLVVLPTGGGKSLCFQVPALCMEGLAVVVSPLISLMKDQVDALESNGVAAAFLNSTQRLDEQRDIANRIRNGDLKLLYVAPERLLTDRMLEFLSNMPLSLFAIDEAHCISDWGHDFRPEYRGLKVLKNRFPKVPVHAYTATAPEHVRQDIVKQLELVDAEILVGSFDRPNLLYRMLPVDGRMRQVAQVISRHRGQSGIVYCISRKEVERTAGALREIGVKAVPYHAGLSEVERKRNQEAFIRDEAEVVVATVAFGMGIDKPDVRFVVHAGMPKSVEHYQQESGRAGRDGLEAECVLLYSTADVISWKEMQKNLEPSVQAGAHRALNAIHNLCTNATCRHKALTAYFGQQLGSDNCGACDVCLGELDQVDDPVTLGQKVLSCVLRLDQRFGADHTTKVLLGSTEKRILQLGHDRLSTYGLLKENDVSTVRQWIEQLISQDFLERVGEYQILRVTDRGKQLLRRDAIPVLTQPAKKSGAPRRSAAENQSWEGVDRGLFEHLRQLRHRIADERRVPAYVVFGDTTLRELACCRPSTLDRMRMIRGIGQQKLQDFGQAFLDALDQYCQQENLIRDAVRPAVDAATSALPLIPGKGASALASFALFREGKSIDSIVSEMNRARSTVYGYLAEYLLYDRITDPTPWLRPESVALIPQIESAITSNTDGRLKTIFEALNGQVGYEEIRVVSICMKNRSLHS